MRFLLRSLSFELRKRRMNGRSSSTAPHPTAATDLFAVVWPLPNIFLRWAGRGPIKNRLFPDDPRPQENCFPVRPIERPVQFSPHFHSVGGHLSSGPTSRFTQVKLRHQNLQFNWLPDGVHIGKIESVTKAGAYHVRHAK